MKDAKQKKAEGPCAFCALERERIAMSLRSAQCVFDKFPVTLHHCLIIPKRHVSTIDELSAEELRDLLELAKSVKSELKKKDPTVQGFNLGINEGAAAGQTIFHLHLHVIPRRTGDVCNARGGVRGVIPGKASY